MSVRATVQLGYCLVQLMSTVHGLLSGQVTVRLGYFLLGKRPSSYCLLGMCPRGSVHWATVRLGYCLVELMSTIHGLLYGQVTVQLGYCPVGLLSSQATVFWVSVHRVTVCWGCVLGKVSIGLLSGWATVRISVVFTTE